MALKVAIQMDPIDRIDIGGDFTFALALEAQDRGHKLWYYLPKHLAQRGDKVSTRAHTLAVRNERGNHFTIGGAEPLDLATMRRRPAAPGPALRYGLHHDHAHPRAPAQGTLVVNDPLGAQLARESLRHEFPDLMPPTLITSDPKRSAPSAPNTARSW